MSRFLDAATAALLAIGVLVPTPQAGASGEPVYDLLLTGGRVIDPKNERDGRFDVAVVGDRIHRVEAGLRSLRARKVVDVSDYIVTPGLIDIHAHYDVTGPSLSLNPDHNSLRFGVTTAVDAGTSGWKRFEEFKAATIDRAKTRVLALLNIVGAGMYGSGEDGPENDLAEMDVGAAVRMVARHPEAIVGIKTAHYQPADWEAVDRALEAAERSNTVLMVDFHPKPGRGYEELILERLRPGNIHTHFLGRLTPQLDENKRIRDILWKARERGILFDVGHGSGSFWFRIAVPAIRQGFLPDTISTDLHKNSVMLPRATLTNVMSKFLNIGMTLEQVIARTTLRPARAIRRLDLGSLDEGSVADIAVLKLERGRFAFLDSGRAKHIGDRRLTAALTVRAGEIVWDLDGLAAEDFEAAGPYSNFK